MKRTLYIIATAVALVFTASACSSDVFQKADKPLTPIQAGTVGIEISNVTDNSFDVTLTPSAESAYYAYLVDNDEYYPAIDASKLYTLSYTSVASGSIKYVEGESFTFTVEAEPNTLYTIYAVCASIDGTVGEVTYDNVTTSDGVAPELDVEDFQTLGNQILLPFSESVKLVEGKKVTAQIYSLIDLWSIDAQEGARAHRHVKKAMLSKKPKIVPEEPEDPIEVDPIEEGPVVVEGEVQIVKNQVLVTFPEIDQPGAYYAVSFEDGTFEDYAGNPCPGLVSEFLGCDWDDDEEAYLPIPAEGCVFGHIDNEPFTFSTEKIPEMVTDLYTEFDLTSEFEIFDYTGEGGSATITYKDASKTITADYTLEWWNDWGLMDANLLAMFIPAEMSAGMTISFSVAADHFMDAWGNLNAAVKTSDILFAFDYTVDDLLGAYYVEAEAATASSTEMYMIIDSVEDNDEGYNVAMTYLDGYSFTYPVYGTFDTQLGKVTFPAPQYFGVGSSYIYALTGYRYDGSTPVVLSVPAVGTVELAEGELVWGAYSKSDGSYLGWFDIWTAIHGERLEEEEKSKAQGSADTREGRVPMTASVK